MIMSKIVAILLKYFGAELLAVKYIGLNSELRPLNQHGELSGFRNGFVVRMASLSNYITAHDSLIQDISCLKPHF